MTDGIWENIQWHTQGKENHLPALMGSVFCACQPSRWMPLSYTRKGPENWACLSNQHKQSLSKIPHEREMSLAKKLVWRELRMLHAGYRANRILNSREGPRRWMTKYEIYLPAVKGHLMFSQRHIYGLRPLINSGRHGRGSGTPEFTLTSTWVHDPTALVTLRICQIVCPQPSHLRERWLRWYKTTTFQCNVKRFGGGGHFQENVQKTCIWNSHSFTENAFDLHVSANVQANATVNQDKHISWASRINLLVWKWSFWWVDNRSLSEHVSTSHQLIGTLLHSTPPPHVCYYYTPNWKQGLETDKTQHSWKCSGQKTDWRHMRKSSWPH